MCTPKPTPWGRRGAALILTAALALSAAAACRRPAGVLEGSEAGRVALLTPEPYAILRPAVRAPEGGDTTLPVRFEWSAPRGAVAHEIRVYPTAGMRVGGQVAGESQSEITKQPRWSVGLGRGGYAWDVTAVGEGGRVLGSSPLRAFVVCDGPGADFPPDLQLFVDRTDLLPAGIVLIGGRLFGDSCSFVELKVNEGAATYATPFLDGAWSTQVVLPREGDNTVLVTGSDGEDIEQVALTLRRPPS